MKRRTLVIAYVSLSGLFLLIVLRPMSLLLLVKPDLIVIELERTGSYGICPIYSLRILGDGQVHYEGQRFVLVEGALVTRLTPGQVQELVTLSRTSIFQRCLISCRMASKTWKNHELVLLWRVLGNASRFVQPTPLPA